MASKASLAASAINRAAKQYEGLMIAYELLSEIGSLDNAKAEAEQGTAEARACAAATKKDTEAVIIENKRLRAVGDAIVADAETEAKAIIDASNAAAEKYSKSAQATADAMIDGAMATIEDKKASTKGAITKLTKRHDELIKLVSEEEAKVSSLEQRAKEAEAKLRDIKSSIESLTGNLV